MQEWNEKSDRKAIETELFQNYIDSLDTETKSGNGKLLRLRAGECIVPPPLGLKRVLTGTNTEYNKNLYDKQETELIETEDIKTIRKVFEMKAKRYSTKEISNFIKKETGVYKSPKHLTDIYKNTIYKGFYTHTNNRTGEVTTYPLKYRNNTPPISSELWEQANGKIGKRPFGFGDLQKHHLAR